MLNLRFSRSKASSCLLNSRRYVSDKFQPGDYALITPLKSSYNKKQWLSRPLKDSPSAKIGLNFGKIKHTDIIGKTPLGEVHTLETKSKLAKYTVSIPTLEQWVNFSERNAQPIYTFDSQAIVALTDLHIDYPEAPTEEGAKITPLQFLEAGTGHGSLSIAIAKALHPANALAHYSNDLNLRGAVLHSVDCNKNHSITGKRTVKGFRRGMYLNDVEFHIADSPTTWINSEDGQNWVERELVSRKDIDPVVDTNEDNAFLSGVFLDMPGYHEHMVKLAPYVKTGGFIIVFCPSITQIVEAIDLIADENEKLAKMDPPSSLHIEHERTVQLLDGAGGGLKEWDTRRAVIRSTGKIGYSVRPKVGVRTVGGGFVAIWRKMGKNVNLEFEKELIDNYEPKVEEDLPGTSTNEASDIPPTESHVKVEPTKEGKNSTDAENGKEALFAPDLLTTDPEVLEDAAKKMESDESSDEAGEPIPDVDLKDVNPDFKVEEATLIPHSVLDTVYHSCHGDPDVNVGKITDVYMIETLVPEELLPEHNSSSSTEETHQEVKIEEATVQPASRGDFGPTDPEATSSGNTSRGWTKHTLL